jgi:hypothetical protein
MLSLFSTLFSTFVIATDFMRLLAASLLFAVLLVCSAGAQIGVAQDSSLAAASDPFDTILVDATYVPCTDTTESLRIFTSGRGIYARGKEGALFSITTGLVDDMKDAVQQAQSATDTASLDSCTTVGVILAGPRFLLINNSAPTKQTKPIQVRLERLRKFARKKLESAMERLSETSSQEPDTAIVTLPEVAMEELRRNMNNSPITTEWRCKGTVTVRAYIGREGEARRAFVSDVEVKGKCGALLVTSALRGVLRTRFKPATKRNGRPTSAWVDVPVQFQYKRR